MPKHTIRGLKKGTSRYRAAKHLATKERKAKAKKNMDTFFLKATSVNTIVPTQGVSVANYVYGGVSLLGGNLLANAEFNFYRLQYDKYRVNSVTVKWVPKANVLDQTVAQNDNFNTTGDGKIHTCVDRDGNGPSSVALMSRYPSYRQYSIMKQWKRTYGITYPTGVWLDCQDPFGNTQVIATLGLGGGLTWYAENFLEDNYEAFNEPVAAIELQWNIVFQGKVSGSFTFATDEGGKVLSVTIAPIDPTETLPLSKVTNIRGDVVDTRMVDEVNDINIKDTGVPA